MEDAKEIQLTEEIARLRLAVETERQLGIALSERLARVNAEFELFVSRAAHNLRDSLRDVSASSQLLAETSSARPDSEDEVLLRRIQDGAAAMQGLLTDMVDYCNTAGADREVSPVELEAVLNQALLFTDALVMKRGAIVTHGPLPVVPGDFEWLCKVLQHLIRNAIEYSDAPSPRVHLSAARDDSGWVISVEDNGPGIEPAFQSRIFEVFRRLHGREHPGNGLGLPLCRRIIEWHGGRIWLESAPPSRSTFYFTLPAA